MSASAPPKELQEALPHDPRLWARNYLRHPNDPTRPYDFYGDTEDEFLYYLVDDEGPMNPEQWGDINIFLFARGVLKTWTCTTIASWGIDMYPVLEGVATAPVDDQRGEVIDRFKGKVEMSGMIERRVKDNEGHQKFKNVTLDPDTGQRITSYSALKSRSAWGEGDKLRGLHAHFGIIDEAQDVDENTFSTFLEAIDRSVPQVDYFPTIFIIGTPKLANTFFHKLWRLSDQKTWDAEAREWISEGESSEFLPEELRVKREELQERLDELEWAKEEGMEVDEEEMETLRDAIGEMEGFTVHGWHVDQHNSPLHDPRSIAFKKETYSKRKYENEVNARFYSPENDLIVNDDVWASLDEEQSFRASRRADDTKVVLGVDWGGGDGEGAASTVVAIGEQYENGTIEVLNIDVFDSSMGFQDEVEQISEYMRLYDVDVAVVDEGYGDSERQVLQDEHGFDNLFGCYYGNIKNKEEIKWNRFKEQKRFFTASKTYMVRKFAEDFKSGNIMIPKGDLSFGTKHDLGTRIIDELTAPYTDRVETSGGKKKLRVISDRRDDIFDAFTYMWIAANKAGSNRKIHEMKSHMRPGH